MQHTSPDDKINVACVVDNEARVYGAVPIAPSGARRPYMYAVQFPTHGAAKQFADEYETTQRERARKRG